MSISSVGAISLVGSTTIFLDVLVPAILICKTSEECFAGHPTGYGVNTVFAFSGLFCCKMIENNVRFLNFQGTSRLPITN